MPTQLTELEKNLIKLQLMADLLKKSLKQL